MKNINAKFVDRCSQSPCFYMKGVAVIANSCSEPVGVQIKIIGYDGKGTPLDTNEFWPASTSNIPPGDYVFSLDQALQYDPAIATFSVRPVQISKWRP